MQESLRQYPILVWRQGAQPPPNMIDPLGATVGVYNTAYFFGSDYHVMYSYSLSEDKWTELESCQRRGCGLAVVNNKLTAIGGSRVGDASATNSLFSATEDSSEFKWRELLPRMPTRRRRPLAITTTSHLVVAGGNISSRPDMDILDLSTLQWSSVNDLPVSLTFKSHMSFYSGRLYLSTFGSMFSCSFERLVKSCDPSSVGDQNSLWTKLAVTTSPASTQVTVKEHVLAINIAHETIHLYDKNTNSWSIVTQTDPRPHHHYLHGIAYVSDSPSNKLVVVDTHCNEIWIGNLVQ